MEDFIREQSSNTPGIVLRGDGYIRISGRSIHENPDKFFTPLVDWVDEYMKRPADVTTVDIQLEYFNSSSAKYILTILQILSSVVDQGKDLRINWSYEQGDDDILERGQYYSSVLGIPFNFIETI
jgi:hypothetical protein